MSAARWSLLGVIACMAARAQTAPIPVKVVVVTMFERGEDAGDTPGEYQLWVEREHLDRVMPVAAAYRHVRLNHDGVLGMVTGIGTAKAAASVMALGLDPRFDFSKAYWVVAGIGGGDPADVSLGSAVWADHVIDGDLAYEVDARDIPSDWATGYVPLRRLRPYDRFARRGRASPAFPTRSSRPSSRTATPSPAAPSGTARAWTRGRTRGRAITAAATI